MVAIKNRTGETSIANNGQLMTIIAYRRSDDIDIKFEDGEIVYHKSYSNFLKGRILKPRQDIHNCVMESISKNGQKMKIIKIRKSNDIDIQFEDGTIVKHKTYQNFISGYIRNPKKMKSKRIEENISSIGLKMKIINFRNSKDIDVEFEDGKIIKNTRFHTFFKGQIRHPDFINGHRDSNNYFGYTVKFAFKYNDSIYYLATNIKTGFEFIATLQELYKGSTTNE